MLSSLKRRLALAFLLSAAALAAQAQATDLLISEYAEGSSNNKAVEIYNGTGAAVDLAAGGYKLQLYFNGSSAVGATINLSGTLAAGDVFVVANSSETLIDDSVIDLRSGSLTFNGDDAVVLANGSGVVDSIGQVGFDPGTQWGTPPASTLDHTIRRDCSVAAGDSVTSDAFDPSVEWDGFDIDTFGGLGARDCGSGGTPVVSFGSTSAAEGDSGTTPFFFTISSNIAPTTDLNIGYTTVDGTATTAGNDYVAKSGTATIAAGTKSVTISVDVNGDTTTEPNETFSIVVTNAGGAVISNGTGTGTINNDDVTLTPIHDIQGNGDSSPLVGQAVTTRGIVTGRKGNGFFLQSADADADADPATSEGVYVFTSSAPPADAAVGNLVQVAATVQEFSPSQDPLQPPLTELGFATVTLLSTGNALPTPVALSASFPDPEGGYDQLERVEGMRVSAASLTVVGPTDGTTNEPDATGSSNGVFYATVTGLPRPFRSAGIQAPDPAPSGSIPPIPRWDTSPETMEVDSDALGANKLDLAAGAIVTGVVGPMDYGFRRYTILPEATPTVAGTGEAVTAARLPSDDEFTVASYNLERFFDTVNDPAIGEPVLTAAAFANRLNKASLGIRNELHMPDIVAVMEVENLSTLQQLASKVNLDTIAAGQPYPQYAAYLQEGNDVGGIDVGFLVKTAYVYEVAQRVHVVDVTQFGKDTTWIDPSDGQPSLLNDRPPLLLRAIVNYVDGRSFPVSVFAVHQRSLNGISDETVSGATTAGDRVRRKRQAQAEYLAGLVQARETADPSEHLVVAGDFNAFDFNDGYVDPMGVVTGLPTPDDQPVVPNDGVDLVDPDLMNLHYLPEANKRYSYVFDGQAQSLDHILVNQALGADLASYDLDHARMNADFPETNRNDPDSPSRLSDHDPAIAYFALTTIERADLEMTATISPAEAHMGNPVEFTVNVTDAGPDAATNPGVGISIGWPVPDFHATNVPAGWTCEPPEINSTTMVACNAPTMAAGTSAQFKFEGIPESSESPFTLYMATAVTAETFDPDDSDNDALATAEIAPTQADLSIAMHRTGIANGTLANFRVPVANAGPDAADNVHVTITGNVLRTVVTLAQPAGWTCRRIADLTVRIDCDRAAAMAAGRSETIAFSVMVPRKGALEFDASVSSDTADPDAGNNRASYTRP
jgi:predicted extracellular nuclease